VLRIKRRLVIKSDVSLTEINAVDRVQMLMKNDERRFNQQGFADTEFYQRAKFRKEVSAILPEPGK